MADNLRRRRITFLEAVQAIGYRDIDEVADNTPDASDEEVIDEAQDDNMEGPVPEPQLPDIEVFEEDSSSEESDHGDELEANDVIRSPNGVEYREQGFEQRLRRRNLLTQAPRVLGNPENEREAFLLFYTPDIILLILRETNRKARDVRREHNMRLTSVTRNFTQEELEAGFAIIIRAGLDRDNFTSLDELWDPIDSRPFYRVVMSKNRFKFLLRTMRFDNYRNRLQRQQHDRMAAVTEVWDLFNNSLRQLYIPNESLTIDEQLVGYRGRIPGRTYMPCKPRKYGIKFYWICESATGFALFGMIYSGRRANEPVHHNLARDIVMTLSAPFFGTGRDIVMDRYFTSHALIVELLAESLTVIATVMSNRRGVPATMKTVRGRNAGTSRFLYDHTNKIILVSYVPKPGRNVLLFSSSHSTSEVSAENNKPKIILDYNKTKAGVDILDQNTEEYSCIRKTTRWPMLINYNLINVAMSNAYLVMKARNPNYISRSTFMKKVTHQLAINHVRARAATMRTDTKTLAQKMGFLEQVNNNAAAIPQRPAVRRRCHGCGTQTRSSCSTCLAWVCPRHRRQVKQDFCLDCQQ